MARKEASAWCCSASHDPSNQASLLIDTSASAPRAARRATAGTVSSKQISGETRATARFVGAPYGTDRSTGPSPKAHDIPEGDSARSAGTASSSGTYSPKGIRWHFT